nr:hypothetical protein Itr_chr03CG26790 [Ipomoea trifida]
MNEGRPHKVCMKRGVCKAETRRSNSEHYSFCTPSFSDLLQLLPLVSLIKEEQYLIVVIIMTIGQLCVLRPRALSQPFQRLAQRRHHCFLLLRPNLPQPRLVLLQSMKELITCFNVSSNTS